VTVEITIDRQVCMGSGNCAYWAPGVFDLDGDGIAVVVGGTEGRDDEIRLAEENCPTAAIQVD
jgi:ferredoxin